MPSGLLRIKFLGEISGLRIDDLLLCIIYLFLSPVSRLVMINKETPVSPDVETVNKVYYNLLIKKLSQ